MRGATRGSLRVQPSALGLEGSHVRETRIIMCVDIFGMFRLSAGVVGGTLNRITSKGRGHAAQFSAGLDFFMDVRLIGRCCGWEIQQVHVSGKGRWLPNFPRG